MGVSRPVVIALVGAALVGALYAATMSGRQADSGSSPPPAAAAAEKNQGAGAANETAASPRAKRSARPRPAAKQRTAAHAKPSPSAKASPPAKTSAPTVKAPSKPTTTSTGTKSAIPAAITRALAAKQTVVIFFYQRGSADDDATAKAVDSVRGRRGVKVFSIPISRLGELGTLTGAAGISQAPAVVVISPKGTARLIEGYVDEKSLVQEVADAR